MIRPGRHIILDDREEGRVFTGDIVKVYTDRGEEVYGRLTTVTMYGVGIETESGEPLRVLPYKWIDAMVKEMQDVES